MLGESRIKAVPSSHTNVTRKGRAIDGFIRKSPNTVTPQVVKPVHVAQQVHKPVSKPVVAKSKKKMDMIRIPGDATSLNRKQERSQTLMRSVVKKPQTTIKPNIKTAAPTELIAKPTSTIAKQLEKKVSVTQVNPVRLAPPTTLPRASTSVATHQRAANKWPSQMPTPLWRALQLATLAKRG